MGEEQSVVVYVPAMPRVLALQNNNNTQQQRTNICIFRNNNENCHRHWINSTEGK